MLRKRNDIFNNWLPQKYDEDTKIYLRDILSEKDGNKVFVYLNEKNTGHAS